MDGLGKSWDEREESNEATDLSDPVELFLVIAMEGAGFWDWKVFPIGVLLVEVLGGNIGCKSVDCVKNGFSFAGPSLGFCSASSVGFVAEKSGFEGRDEVGAGAKRPEADRGFSVD